MPKTRLERDSLGSIAVANNCLWGAQTQRSLLHFASGGERFRWPRALIRALGLVKHAAIRANADLGRLSQAQANAMLQAAAEVVAGDLDRHFPLIVFQTGSGTHTNMNANEVIANRAIEILGGQLGSNDPIHPNDHVNLGQSSNDVFPTVMHIAVVEQTQQILLPVVADLRAVLAGQAEKYHDLVKTGRTHLQDAAPLTVAQEMSGWIAQLDFACAGLAASCDGLLPLAIGGTAVGTGLNTGVGFGARVAALLGAETGLAFSSAENKFFALSAHEPLVAVSAALRTLALALMKIANDIRWLASGPRCGLGELRLPQNEPGSSIMPGKVNPTQCEALTMVCTQVFGNDAAVAFADSQGNFQLNAFKPVIIHNVLESITLLADAGTGFNHFCVADMEPDRRRIADHLQDNLMLVTALNNHIGYDKAAAVAKLADREGKTLKEACLQLGFAGGAELDAWLDPRTMVRPDDAT